MSHSRAALSLGSNLGDRLAHLQQAVDALAAEPGVQVQAVSGVYETAPVGGPEQPDYLNAVVVVDTTLGPEQLLDVAHRLEAAAGRTRELHWGPRTLDVDVLALDALVVDSPRLTLPHPRAHQRGFVLVPWADVDPDFVLVGHGRVRDLRDEVGDLGVVPAQDGLAVPA